MIPLVLALKDITAEQFNLFEKIRFLVEQDEDYTTYACHRICEDIALHYPELLHYRGKFNHADHSWLVFADNPNVILDPYPWACASGPLLITIEGALNPWRRLYIGELVTKDDE